MTNPRHRAPGPAEPPTEPLAVASPGAAPESAAPGRAAPGPAAGRPAARGMAAPAGAGREPAAGRPAARGTAAPAGPPPARTAPAGSGRPGRRRRGPSSLRLVWVYPDLLSTYGDRGNLLVLERRARLHGIEAEALAVNADQPVPRSGDIYLMGGGEDLPQILAARRLRADGGLAGAVARGAVVFAVCAGYQVLGVEFGGSEGEPVRGLEILDLRSGRGKRRAVGEIVADVDPGLGVPRLTGFENHQGLTRLGPGVRPLARVTAGVGNGDGTEGACAGKVLGTYLHGPALVRNPGLADLLLTWAAGPLAPLEAAQEGWVRRLREERLAAVPG